MADGFIVRKGGVTEEVLRTAVPSINFISANTTSLTFTFKNNEDAQVDLYYGVTTPPTTKITLAANATSSNQTITGLDNTQNFDVYSYAIVTDPTSKKIKSEIVETQAQTLIPTPTITQVSKTGTSITFTVRNNSRVAADVLYDLVTPPVETTLQLAANTTSANQTISGFSPAQTVTVFAQTKVAGFTDSTIVSSTVTTDISFTAATGGTTQEYNSGGKRFKTHTFTSNGNFVVSTVGDNIDDRNKVDYLIIAGGGSGGASGDAGGGAGGYRTTVTPTPGNTAVNPKVTVTATTFAVVVGAGGTGSTSRNGANGSTSSVFSISATGGGGGGQASGLSGGSGGGGAGGAAGTGGSSTSGQGRNGGNGSVNSPNFGSGGGGGAGAVGANAGSTFGGNGGNGLANNLRTGSNQTRAGGGGGGTFDGGTRGLGGTGGGGNAGITSGGNANGDNGTANTGGGGGGGFFKTAAPTAGSGGSGIVVIRYEIATV